MEGVSWHFCIVYLFSVYSNGEPMTCDVRARTDSGWVCGLRRVADDGVVFASFLGVPYARQPVGQLRFAELKPAEPWNDYLDATQEGPVCPQYDKVYGNLVRPDREMSEACIRANIHVPEAALPSSDASSSPVEDPFGHAAGLQRDDPKEEHKGLPILVFIHGGGFQSGSGDTDLHGPEYLVGKGMLVATFNYRINVFGFLSINTPDIPGNAGLRDMITFLRWMKKNARSFGGDPENVTLMGQSAGAACAHILSLSESAKGLFKRLILLSGTGIPSFFSASPIYAKTIATMFLKQLGINSTNPEEIHKELITVPLERIIKANQQVQFDIGLTSFVPVVEGIHPGVTRVLDDEPIDLIKRGRGKEYPIIMGFTNAEGEFFRRRIQYQDLIGRIQNNSALLLNSRLVFSTPPNVSRDLGKKVGSKYFNGPPNLEDFIKIVTYNFFEYPAFKLAQWRSETDSAATYMYEFSYTSDLNIIRDALMLVDYEGATHVEDLTYVFKERQYLGDFGTLPPRDNLIKAWMTSFIYNFMMCSNPTCIEDEVSPWPKVQKGSLNYQVVAEPAYNSEPTPKQWDMISFFDSIEEKARNTAFSTPTAA
ncbi:hypothetical protein K1T71_010559 [Dendrolimus kikuchii]|uniref:Uncharacterized protein n=1 Tax=Dendrolimus kikuchii TaxID=765133 RepID=A0ACC1CPG9_9NEOP|nr:hypothetical protein K1T71_010559 [Dendrolimus kikuchii]